MFQKSTSNVALSYDEEEDQTVPEHHVEDVVETVVGPSVQVEGDFASEGNIVVKGVVSGSVKTSRLLTVEEGARIVANVDAGSALISGDIKGDVTIEDSLELTSSAQVFGNIECETLVVEAGAKIHGKVTMSGITIAAEKKKTRVRKTTKDTDESMEA